MRYLVGDLAPIVQLREIVLRRSAIVTFRDWTIGPAYAILLGQSGMARRLKRYGAMENDNG